MACLPQRWLGAPCPFGLALPSAQPSAATLYGPRGVWLDDRHLIVADTGNHRVLIWRGLPSRDHQPADLVLGQADFTTEGPNARGASKRNGLHMPTGVAIVNGDLIVADAWNHRLLRWDGVPSRSNEAPSQVFGQADFESIEANRAGHRDGESFYWPFGFHACPRSGRFLITDTGNRRVLGWHSNPFDHPRPADFVLGQPDLTKGEENRGAPASASSLRWPHAAAVFENRLFIADAGNHRVLSWPAAIAQDQPATGILGQKDFASNQEFVMARQSAQTLRFPYGAAASGAGWLAVADTANNRVLVWNRVADALQAPARAVIGQPNFAANGENHWKAVAPDTLCWPYGLAAHGDLLAVADSGNNRVMLWRVALDDAGEREPEIQKETERLLCV